MTADCHGMRKPTHAQHIATPTCYRCDKCVCVCVCLVFLYIYMVLTTFMHHVQLRKPATSSVPGPQGFVPTISSKHHSNCLLERLHRWNWSTSIRPGTEWDSPALNQGAATLVHSDWRSRPSVGVQTTWATSYCRNRWKQCKIVKVTKT